jgi:hypothetical protein
MVNKPAGKHARPSYIKDLILLFAVPLLIAVVAAALVYIPRAMAHPTYDFVYSYCREYGCADDYSVDDGRIVQTAPTGGPSISSANATLYYYNISDNSTKSLSYNEAKQYRLNPSSKSPDGYSLEMHSGYGGLFGGDDGRGWFLKNGAKQKVVKLSSGADTYSEQIKFLGWVNR